jgi:hypothetical protein
MPQCNEFFEFTIDFLRSIKRPGHMKQGVGKGEGKKELSWLKSEEHLSNAEYLLHL